MEIYLIVYLLFNTIWSSWYAIHTANRSDNMAWWCQLLIAVVPALITGIITLVIARKSQLNKNSEIIKELKESNEQSFKSIKEDIGRGSLSSLTEQHKSLEKEIATRFSCINNRYEKEDAAYRKYSRQQLDLDATLKFFLEDYKRLIAENSGLNTKVFQLEQRIDQLEEKVQLDATLNRNQHKGITR